MSTPPATQGASRQVRTWAKCVIAGVFLVSAVAVVGAVYQSAATSRDRQLVPPEGVLIDIGGYRLHLYCIGRGEPTVVLDSGLGDYSIHWRRVQPGMAQFTRVCAYDRAGLGWSDPSPRSRTSSVIARELHTLLHQAGVQPPYVLVGHSLGGLNVRMFQSLYPSEIVGMVLVDASHPDQDHRLPPAIKTLLASYQLHLRNVELLMPFGVSRLLRWCGEGNTELQPALRANGCRSAAIRETLAESAAFDESAREVRSAGRLGDLPLVVISEDPEKNMKEFTGQFEIMQADLARLSDKSTRVTAKGSGHQIHWERPDIVIDAIRTLVAGIRQRGH